MTSVIEKFFLRESFPSLKFIEDFIWANRLNECRWCGGTLKEAKRYAHPNGVKLEKVPKKQWVYFPCPDCGYDWSLWKLLNRGSVP